MRFKVPFTGVHVGDTCVDGSAFGARVVAHAHLSGVNTDKFRGYVCARTTSALLKYLRHEVAHLMTGATHENQAEEARWRAGLKTIGGHVPARRKH